MGMHFDKALNIHPDALRVRAERTQILASNIANASTPGYQARDIDFKSVLSGTEANTDFPLGTAGNELMYRMPNSPSRDGNTVEIGVEQAEFAQNVSEFQTCLTFLNITFKGLAKAISG